MWVCGKSTTIAAACSGQSTATTNTVIRGCMIVESVELLEIDSYIKDGGC